ncbi:MAG: hypothetical protein ACOCXT_06400 [Candidatus Dojkabacteria bacterium]
MLKSNRKHKSDVERGIRSLLEFGNRLNFSTGQGANDQELARRLLNTLEEIFPSVEYNEASGMFRVECLWRDEERKVVAKFSYNKREIKLFDEFLQNLCQQIKDGKFIHLFLQEVRKESFTRFELKKEAEHKYQLDSNKNNQAVSVGADDRENFLMYEKDDLNEISEDFIEYALEGSSSVGRLISIILNSNEPRKVFDIYHASWCSFEEIFISFFTDYHLLFGSFEKIKICNACEKLYLEKRRNRSKYCSDTCRSSARSNLGDRSNCQQRQRVYLNSAYDRVKNHWPKFPGNDDCRKCQIDQQQNRKVGGECPVVKKNNKQLIEEYEKVKWKRRKKEAVKKRNHLL